MDQSDIHDLIAEAAAGACAAVAVALILDKSDAMKHLAAKVPRMGWKADDEDNPPILARLLAGALSTIIFRSTFSVTRTLARRAL
jgi:hypothetical protein